MLSALHTEEGLDAGLGLIVAGAAISSPCDPNAAQSFQPLESPGVIFVFLGTFQQQILQQSSISSSGRSSTRFCAGSVWEPPACGRKIAAFSIIDPSAPYLAKECPLVP